MDVNKKQQTLNNNIPALQAMLKKTRQNCVQRQSYPPTELVEHSDVGIHVVDVVGVGGVLGDVPLLWFGALGGEHVTTVLGLIIHTVETCHLYTRKGALNYSGRWSRKCKASVHMSGHDLQLKLQMADVFVIFP